MLRRQKRISDEKTCFFIHTAHDVRTPLTLIKAPLEEVVEKDMVKAEGMDNVRMALKSVDGLLGLVTSLIDFESTDNYTLRLHVSEYDHHQSDTVSRHLQIDGITAPEMVPEQFLPFLRWNANPRVFHFHTPYMPDPSNNDRRGPAAYSYCGGQ